MMSIVLSPKVLLDPTNFSPNREISKGPLLIGKA
jgi:hypothetical protein